MRRRIESSTLLANLLARVVGSYLSLCQATTRWRIEGRDGLVADLSRGPVIVVMWHERSLMGPVHWPVAAGPLSSLHAHSPIGRVSGALQRQRGLLPMEMAEGQSNLAASRMVLRRAREGVSIGLTGDGPLGPARIMKDAPLAWAIKSGLPIYGYASATLRHRKLKAWDRMRFPLPFGTGGIVFARFVGSVPDRVTESFRADIARHLDAVTQKADQLAGLPRD